MEAQISAIFSDEFPDSSKTRVGLIGDFGINSTALTSQFISKFYNGGFINTELKNQVLSRVKNMNTVGVDLNYGIYLGLKLDSLFHKKNVSLFFSMRDRAHFDARFSNDFYKVGFYGNAAYAGKTANFNDFNLTYLRYQQLQIGLFSSKYDSAARWGIAVSILKGEQYATIFAQKAELYTSEDGQYIDFNTSMQVAQSDTAKKGIGAFNGIGASVDIYFEAPFSTRFGNSKLRVSVADIGAIKFNSRSLYLNQDSVFHYSGFQVNSIYDLQDSTFASSSQDSIIKNIAPFKKQSLSVTLPSTLNLTYETRLSKHFEMTEGIRYVFNGNYHLLTYLKGNFIINQKFSVSATFGYGGYGKFNYGLGMFANLGKGIIIYACSNNIEGFIAPKKACGRAAYISLVKNFK
ncbi:MAG: DUF5723 family protein [Bacteroidetes bacterium]|nr:DUF5723 family protein [Bacteroidota bacterium]